MLSLPAARASRGSTPRVARLHAARRARTADGARQRPLGARWVARLAEVSGPV